MVALDERVLSLFEETSMMEFGLLIQKIFKDRFSKQRKGTTNLKKDPSATKEKEIFPSVSRHQS
jgi:hypothetical protein